MRLGMLEVADGIAFVMFPKVRLAVRVSRVDFEGGSSVPTFSTGSVVTTVYRLFFAWMKENNGAQTLEMYVCAPLVC